ncbi:MAG: NADH-quinone oxidoreductase subunit C [Candidatus Nanopelagicaceae bacterium]|nr:NADH-quinone oxidoreductase subunit C [Candidatus Nanopelagicaceae bacterium]
MKFEELELRMEEMNSPFRIRRTTVGESTWEECAFAIAQNHGQLVTLWASQKSAKRFAVTAIYSMQDEGLLWLDLLLGNNVVTFPDISGLFPSATRMQRAMRDLMGIMAVGSGDNRPWLNHGFWPNDYYPLRKDVSGFEVHEPEAPQAYSFVEVAGDGVHEIAVGPVHAGIIEPGHFRFSVVGEKTLRLEERLGYAHKGVDKAFERMRAIDGHRLAGRISGDSTVAYSWAYCMALESAWKWDVSERALWIRALMLERERIANHLGDVGAIANDAGFTFGLTQFMRLKELWLRTNKEIFGHRFMMDCVLPGGVKADVSLESIAMLREQIRVFRSGVERLRAIYEDHSGLQDRFMHTGIVDNELALRLGLTGLAGRASGVVHDVRVDSKSFPYTQLNVNVAFHEDGDVAARVSVRFDEIADSLNLLEQILEKFPAGNIYSPWTKMEPSGTGAGWVEGWRGGVFLALSVGKGGNVERCHLHDPSWQNWPVLEYAVIGDIVPDFPLINKSFNLTYSGHDR